jgi:molybdopterin converting factor small subunit
VFESMEITVYGPLRTAADGKVLTVATGSSTDGTDKNAANSNTISEGSESIDTSSVSASSPETVSELITMIAETYPQTKSHLFDCEGTLRPSVRILVNGNKASPETQLDQSADIQLFPAMRGGSGHTVTRYD